MALRLVGALLTMTGCKSGPEPEEDVVEQYTDDLQIDDLRPGTGAVARNGMKLTVQYVGYFTNGTVFDSSRERGPFTFELGMRTVIKGWDRGLVGMKVGGKRRLIVPYHLGYGERPVGAVPPRTRLIFEIELLAVD